MSDAYTKERAGFLERLGRLAGQTTYRVPVEGVGTKVSYLPESHALIVTLSYARGNRSWNPGPEIAYAVATGVENKRDEVIAWLAEKLQAGTGAVGRKYADRIHAIAGISYAIVVHGPKSVKGAELDSHVRKLADIGAAWLSMCLDNTIMLAERSGRDESLSIPKNGRKTA